MDARDTREFISIIKYKEGTTNGFLEPAPGDLLEQEFKYLKPSGISLSDWALVDADVQWECYLRYLAQWAIDHNSDEYEGLSPACYEEWCRSKGFEAIMEQKPLSENTQAEEAQEIAVDLTMYIMAREGETEQGALERLLGLLDSEMCNMADHQISYQAHKSRVV